MTRRTATNPQVAVFCRCGAQWYGYSALDEYNRVPAVHRKRCGVPIAESFFVALGFKVQRPRNWDHWAPACSCTLIKGTGIQRDPACPVHGPVLEGAR